MKVKLKDCKGGFVVGMGFDIAYVRDTGEHDGPRFYLDLMHSDDAYSEPIGHGGHDPEQEVTLHAPVDETWRAACEAFRDEVQDASRSWLNGAASHRLLSIIDRLASQPQMPKGDV